MSSNGPEGVAAYFGWVGIQILLNARLGVCQNKVLYCMILYYKHLICIVLCCILYGIVLYCIVLYCIVLYCTIVSTVQCWWLEGLKF